MTDTEAYCGQCGKPFNGELVGEGLSGSRPPDGGLTDGGLTGSGFAGSGLTDGGLAEAPAGAQLYGDTGVGGVPAGGQPSADGSARGAHPACLKRAALEPPRFCFKCGRRMVVQVEPMGWRAVCSRHGERRG